VKEDEFMGLGFCSRTNCKMKTGSIDVNQSSNILCAKNDGFGGGEIKWGM